jgi:GAF domain-containing protein
MAGMTRPTAPAPTPRLPTDEAFAAFEAALHRSGPRAALAYLARLTSFTTVDAMQDPRLADHVARAAVRPYCGVPVMDAEGELLGTLCHYDVVPRNANELDMPLLLQAASTLTRGHHVPPYPHAA